jgi:hypothetical protein
MYLESSAVEVEGVEADSAVGGNYDWVRERKAEVPHAVTAAGRFCCQPCQGIGCTSVRYRVPPGGRRSRQSGQENFVTVEGCGTHRAR